MLDILIQPMAKHMEIFYPFLSLSFNFNVKCSKSFFPSLFGEINLLIMQSLKRLRII